MWSTYVVLVVTLACAHGHGSGAPESACKDMVPRHPVPPQSTPPPYSITTSTQSVKGGTPMEVVISGKQSTDTVRGLILQARKGDDIVGTFTLAPNDPFAQLLNCGEPGNAVTHKRHDAKYDKQTLTYTWTPPKDFNGLIKFRATIALNGAVFWVGVESGPVQVVS